MKMCIISGIAGLVLGNIFHVFMNDVNKVFEENYSLIIFWCCIILVYLKNQNDE